MEGAGLERPHVAGNSLGGGIALELARMGVVASATALSPVGFWSAAEARYEPHDAARRRTSRRRAWAPQMQRLVRSPAGRQATIGLMYGRPRKRDGEEAAEDLVQLARAPGWEATLPTRASYAFRDGERAARAASRSAGARATAC